MPRTAEKGPISLDSPPDVSEPDENSGVKSKAALGLGGPKVGRVAGERDRSDRSRREPPNETERTRLIAELTQLIREPTVPEPTRLAGLTLIGWLARRRREESPHAIGIEEARQSERRVRTLRGKIR